jgi:hypothetical protein
MMPTASESCSRSSILLLSYTLKLIMYTQTIDAAVPVLVRSLQAQHVNSKLELYQGRTQSLRIAITDAELTCRRTAILASLRRCFEPYSQAPPFPVSRPFHPSHLFNLASYLISSLPPLRFFIHLSRAFQAEEFIAPLLLLLLEKHVPRTGKTKKTDTGSVVPVCLSVIRDASGSAQITVRSLPLQSLG